MGGGVAVRWAVWDWGVAALPRVRALLEVRLPEVRRVRCDAEPRRRPALLSGFLIKHFFRLAPRFVQKPCGLRGAAGTHVADDGCESAETGPMLKLILSTVFSL